jgi:hypothetical protein
VRNKLHDYEGWSCFDLAECKKSTYHKKTWDIDGTETNIDSFFLYHDDKPYLLKVLIHQYNERGDYVERHDTDYNVPDEDGNQSIKQIYIDHYAYKYHELYDQIEEFAYWIITFNGSKWDSVLQYRQELYDWHDVRYPVSIIEPEAPNGGGDDALFIYPNPTSGELIVNSYELTVKSVEIFDVMGNSYGLTVLPSYGLDISHLPSGIYFLRITTETGVVTRKVIKSEL